MTHRNCFLLLLASALHATWAATHNIYLMVGHMQGAPDGFGRRMLGVNGTSPGPAIMVNAGDRIIARVKNIDIKNGTAMHWHGIRQTLSNNMDGAVGVTQKAIKVGETFIYDFVVDDAGTFWYHAHFMTQYMQGMRGALIVQDPLETMYSNRIMMLSDWYHEDEELLKSTKYLVPSSLGREPSPYTAIINGVGQNNSCIKAKRCRYTVTKATAFTADCGAYTKYSELKAAQAKKVAGLTTVPDDLKVTRLQLINSAGMAAFNFSIDDHSFWVLALDGQPVVPQKVTNLLVNVAQRVDLAVCRVKTTGSNSVWIRSVMNQDVFGKPTDTSGGLAMLTYSDAYTSYLTNAEPLLRSVPSYAAKVIKSTPATPLPSGNPISEFQKDRVDPHGLEGGEAGKLSFKGDPSAPTMAGLYPPPAATLSIPIVIDFYNNSANVNVGHFNDVSMTKDEMNRDMTLLEMAAMGMSLEDAKMNITTFSTTEVVELVINNLDGGEHPIHMHGRRMYVIARGKDGDGLFDETREVNNVDPIMRDSVTVAATSYIVVRFVDKNPGVWMMHCHINWHQEEVEMPEEEECIMYCSPSDYLTVGLSSAFVGALFFASIFFVCHRNWNKVDSSDETADLETALVDVESEGKETN